jgi:hypothetical protein
MQCHTILFLEWFILKPQGQRMGTTVTTFCVLGGTQILKTLIINSNSVISTVHFKENLNEDDIFTSASPNITLTNPQATLPFPCFPYSFCSHSSTVLFGVDLTGAGAGTGAGAVRRKTSPPARFSSDPTTGVTVLV